MRIFHFLFQRQFECDCKNGYRGTVCDETDYCANQNCNGNGQCSNTGTAFQCQCDEGIFNLVKFTTHLYNEA